MADPILVAKSGSADLFLLPQMTNRHGLIAGATGTGKTVTLQVLAEALSKQGVPVFTADVKGDLAGISQAGTDSPAVAGRTQELGLPALDFSACPVTFWDILGEQGHPIRATVSEMGPLLLSRLLNLNETQSGILSIAFKIADDNGLLLLDLPDLQAMLRFVGENRKQFTTEYGNISPASVGAIQRGLLALEEQGGEKLFGEPALVLDDLMQTDGNGQGVVNVLVADKIMQSPKIYATFLLWLLSELFEQLPEVGDLEQPRLVFFFDEAHLLFADAPEALQDKVEQVVRLIRSKGVGVFFVTQNPSDIPEAVLGQLGNRVQHALRAFTPRDRKTVRAAAETFRTNENLDVEAAITELGVGEALVSFLDVDGRPEIVQRALVLPPRSQIGPVDPQQRQQIIRGSVIYGEYERLENRESAYEMLKSRAAHVGRQQQELEEEEQDARERRARGQRQGIVEAMTRSAARAIGAQIGRSISRGLLGGLLGGGRRR